MAVAGCATRSDTGGETAVVEPTGAVAVAEAEAAPPVEGSPSVDPTEASPSAVETEPASEESSAPARAFAEASPPAVDTPTEASPLEPDPAVEASSAEDPPPGEAGSVALPELVPGANISMESVEANGQRLVGLACRADRLPLLGSLAVVGSIAEQKRAFDRCAPKGGAVALTWTFRKGRARDVSVKHASKAKVGACVAKAMRKVVAPFSAECGAFVLMGDGAGADEAMTRMLADVEP